MSVRITKTLFILIFLVSKITFAGDIMGITGFDSSLDRFNQYQSPQSCAKKNSTCPKILNELVEDDFESRALIIESRAPICRKSLDRFDSYGPLKIDNTSLIQKKFSEGRFSHLGMYSHSVVKACSSTNSAKATDQLSKFYYYNSRLNEGAAKIAQERVLIAKLLNKTQPRCPSQDILTLANKACNQTISCPENYNLAQLSQSSQKDEEIYDEILNRLKKLPKNCEETESCKKERAAWSASLVGLIQKNPWFVDDDFKRSKNKKTTEERLKKYFNKTEKNLAELQSNIQDASNCLHGAKTKECDIDDMREVLSQTPALPEAFIKDKAENQLTNLMSVQSCLEDGAIDRNHTGKIMKETYLNIGLTIGTLGLGAIANSARLAAMGAYARYGRLLAEGLNLSFDIYAAADSAKEAVEACRTDKMTFQFQKLTHQQICDGKGSALSPSSRDHGSCMVSAGFTAVSALIVIPGGSRLAKLLQESGYLKSAATQVARSVVPATIPNLPKSIKIDSVVKADGQKVLTYQYAEKLPNGTWVKNTRELPVDEISGGINANFPAGRELFEKIAHEKSGKAHMVFVDVGSLGAVNKTFKGGETSGDRYLKSVADKIIENGEGKVTLARLGGDEFGLIIDETDPQKVKKMLENIQSSLRRDHAADAKLIFREEKIARAEQYREEAKRLTQENPNGLTDANKADLRKGVDELAKVQVPDISIGSTQIGRSDNLSSLLERAEVQAKEMKIQTALKFGRSAEKYGSDAIPNARPDSKFMAPISEPSASSTWRIGSSAEKPPELGSLRDLSYTRKEELHHFSSSSITRYEDEMGRSSYRVERYFSNPTTGKKELITTEIPTRGSTGLLDGVHPESQNVILDSMKASEDSVLVMPKLKSLKYLNYFESGTQAGDEMLEAVSETLKTNMKSKDLTFKLNGADFLWSTKNISPADVSKIQERLNRQIMQNPKVKQILDNERAAINSKIAAETRAGNDKAVIKLKEKLKAVDEFKPDLSFKSVSKKEAEKAGSFKGVLKLFDEKFQH